MASETNDLMRLKRAGDESSKTSQKLIDATTNVVNLILQTIPQEWWVDLGRDTKKEMEYFELVMGYRVGALWYLDEQMPIPFLEKPASRLQLGDLREALLPEAQEFAMDVARGLIEKLCEKIEAHTAERAQLITSLNESAAQLKQRDKASA